MEDSRRRALLLGGLVLLLAALSGASAANAGPLTATAPVEASSTNPLAACPPDGSGTNFPNSEVEPWIEVDPTDADNMVGFYQQDRYSNGGAQGNVASWSTNGGATWQQLAVDADIRCLGGRFDRASDPWVSPSPDGTFHFMSLVTDVDPPTGGFGDNGMVYNRGDIVGNTLVVEDPIVLIEDTNPRFLNDKNSMTADPNDSDFVYAVWDRIQTAGGDVNNFENRRGFGFKGPIYFTRTTNGGDSWEEPRKIFESGANKQTIGNQIVVLPESDGGDVIDFFAEVVNNSNRAGGFPVVLTLIRSTNHGERWGNKQTRISPMLPMSLVREDSVIDTEPVPCPDPSDQGACPIRAGDLLPEVAVDPRNGNLYAVWMDARFDGGLNQVDHDNIAFSMSTDGGASWTDPIKVNQTPTSEPNDDQQAFTPSVAVGADGTVGVTYYDFRNNTPDPSTLLTDHFAVHCHSGCSSPASWSETRITPSSFNIREAPFANGYFLGDYVGLDNAANDFTSLFGSAEGGGPSSVFFSRLGP
jgi:hypothetical protein